MAQVPELSPQWPPTDDQLAEIAHGLYWQVEQLSYDLGHRPSLVTPERRRQVADDLATFARLLRGGEPRGPHVG